MGSKRKKAPPRPLQERREPYLRIFLLSFTMMLLLLLPVMLFTGGYFVYYGDFNSQQLPFYHLAREAVANSSYGWNWQTDLGANFIGSYSFYLLGSPFFWLTTLFPQSWVLYLMPYLLALKHAFAALTAYAYIRRFVRSRNAALIGGLLYAFSGFQMYNVFFNHFQDVTAFFPLLLIAMEQRVNENRRGIFALTVAFMAILNYYFFTGQVVFVILYFILRCPAKDFDADLRKFFSIALESVLGVLMAGFMLLPSALAIIDNYRVKSYLWGLDMVAYSDRTRLWRIIQSFFMIPDVPARPNLFQSDYGKWSSIGGYLPMFSMAGVIAFMSQKKKHWATRLTAICMVCACIPVLNSMFYMFNGSYYARWYYMPILIMAMMTAYALDHPKIKWRGGITVCAVMLAGFAVISLLPTKDKDGTIHFLEMAKYPWYVWVTVALTALLLYFTGMIAWNRAHGYAYYKLAVGGTVFSCLCVGFAMLYFGIGLGTYPTTYINNAINGKITLDETPGQFYRVDISEDHDNYPMLWGYSNMRCFHSIVPTSVMDFYDAIDLNRDVASRPEPKNYPLRNLFSVKYYLQKTGGEKPFEDDEGNLIDMPAFTFLKEEKGFRVYENTAYIPMGLAYNYCIDADVLEKSSSLAKQKIMLNALCMSAEQIEKYSDILTPIPDGEKYALLNDDSFIEACKARAAETCTEFLYDSYGFTADITLEQPAMVFFSVPDESGWTAEVNGKAVDVELVNYGFMAVRCEAGQNEITFHYETPGLRFGALASACGLGGLLIYLLWMCIAEHGKPRSRRKYCYDYAGAEQFSEHALYMYYAARKNPFRTIEKPRPAPEYDEDDDPGYDDGDDDFAEEEYDDED